MAASRAPPSSRPSAELSDRTSILAPRRSAASVGAAMMVATSTGGPPATAASSSVAIRAARLPGMKLGEGEELQAIAEGIAAEEALAAVDRDRLLQLDVGRVKPLSKPVEVVDEKAGVVAAAVCALVWIWIEEEVELASAAAVRDG